MLPAPPGRVLSKANELAARLKRFATRIVIFARAMPNDPSSGVLAKQLTGSGTAESANYDAARRARSRAEFIAKLVRLCHIVGFPRESESDLN